MTTIVNNTQLRALALGRKVDRATATLPATTDQTLFTITGGRIILTSVLGEVTTAVQAQATLAKLKSVPTTGTSKDISGTLDLTGFEVGALISLDGAALTTALSGSNAGAALATTRGGIFLPIGSLKLNTAATSTGSVKWSITYIPYDDGSTVAAA